MPPPLIAIETPLRNLFAPSEKLFSLTYKHITEGNHSQLAKRMWEKAQTDEPLKLVRNSLTKVWQAVNDNNEKGTNRS